MGDVLALDCADSRDKVYSVLSMVDWRRRHEKPNYPDFALDSLSLASKTAHRILQQGGQTYLDDTWEILPMISGNLCLCDWGSVLDDAIYRRQFCQQFTGGNWPCLGLTAYQRRLPSGLRFPAFQLDRNFGIWSFRNVPLRYNSFPVPGL